MGKYILVGNAREVATATSILLAMEQMFEQYKAQNNGAGSSRPLPNYVKGLIFVKLYFEGTAINTQRPHFVEKSFRLGDNPQTITLERLKALAERTKSRFNVFSFKTGIQTFTYNSPEQGFNRVWGHFESLAEAKRLFEQMLDVPGFSPKWERLSCSFVPEPGDRFSDTTPKATQAGIIIKTELERPSATVKFTRATIKFPHIKHEIDFVDIDEDYVFNSLEAIEAYQDLDAVS